MDETRNMVAASWTAEFETYYRADLKPLIWWLIRLSGSVQDAEDAAHEAMKSLWQVFPSIDNPAAYTRHAARRALYRDHDRVKRGHETMLRAAASGTTHTADPFDADVRNVIAMLQLLPQSQREVIALAMDGYKPMEMALILDQDPATVRSNLRHARQNLTRRITQQNAETTGKETSHGPRERPHA